MVLSPREQHTTHAVWQPQSVCVCICECVKASRGACCMCMIAEDGTREMPAKVSLDCIRKKKCMRCMYICIFHIVQGTAVKISSYPQQHHEHIFF